MGESMDKEEDNRKERRTIEGEEEDIACTEIRYKHVNLLVIRG
jgi:hypothetical protein